ncbi:two-component system sensor histidine kinase VicK [Hazenella coriacea]|uniref:histidine kinase n=2 Tax=Hazenella coriacea TaxID=1179467 RepID=A0A4R3L8W7_9BACL|nr:two-component system sensor histidine kinase VicK [Hazenella coriacea]
MNGDQMKKWVQSLNSVQWKLVVIFILLIIIAMELIGVYFIRQLEDYYKLTLRNNLEAQSNLMQNKVQEVLSQPLDDETKGEQLAEILKQYVYLNMKGPDRSTVRIIDDKAFILASTKKEELIKNNRFIFDQPNSMAESLIVRSDNDRDYLLYNLPLKKNGNIIGYISVEASLQETYSNIRGISKILIQITIAALVITCILVVILARTITIPVKEVTEQATAMAAGDFDRQVDVRSGDEIGRLGMAFNHLASHLRMALAQKEEEKEKLETVLANMSDGVIATDRSGKVIVKNRWAENLLDHSIELGESINTILKLTDPIHFPLLEERQTFIELNSDDPEAYTIIKVTFTPIRIHGHDTIGMVAVLEDVTEQEKLDRQRKEFVANVSHELRTPLTTIKSYLEALDDGAIHEPELATRFLRVTQQEADRMTRLIHDLLQLSRLDAKQSHFNKKATYVEDILEDAADRFSIQCKQKGIQFSLQLSESLPKVWVDRDKMDQVLDNLISNAVKHTSEGGVTVSAHPLPTDGMIEISISDTGIGIPKKDLSRIFERFYRVDKARSRSLGGTGLGLAIAKEIIDAHKGDIKIDSVYRKGTTVTFTLPPYNLEVRS